METYPKQWRLVRGIAICAHGGHRAVYPGQRFGHVLCGNQPDRFRAF